MDIQAPNRTNQKQKFKQQKRFAYAGLDGSKEKISQMLKI